MSNQDKFDVVIIGGGPAGSQCALWLKMMGFSPCILEKRATLGGAQNDNPFLYQPIALINNPMTGRQISQLIHESVNARGVAHHLNANVMGIQRTEHEYFIFFEAQREQRVVKAKYLVLSSGVAARTGNLTASDHVLIGPGDHIVNYDFQGKRVAILGGGDNAFENYRFILGKLANQVHIYARVIRSRGEFVNNTPTRDIFLGECQVDAKQQTVNGHHYDVIVVMYGWQPDLSYLSALDIEHDSKGFLITHPKTGETSLPNMYAIGDVANRMPPCCITAMADGIVVAHAIQQKIDNRPL